MAHVVTSSTRSGDWDCSRRPILHLHCFCTDPPVTFTVASRCNPSLDPCALDGFRPGKVSLITIPSPISIRPSPLTGRSCPGRFPSERMSDRATLVPNVFSTEGVKIRGFSQAKHPRVKLGIHAWEFHYPFCHRTRKRRRLRARKLCPPHNAVHVDPPNVGMTCRTRFNF